MLARFRDEGRCNELSAALDLKTASCAATSALGQERSSRLRLRSLAEENLEARAFIERFSTMTAVSGGDTQAVAA